MSRGVLLLGVCFVLTGCGSSGSDRAPVAGGGSSGEAGASPGEAGASPGEAGASGSGDHLGSGGSAGRPSDGGESGSGDGGAAGAAMNEPETLAPPATIDLKLCGDANDSADACNVCCHNSGFTASSTYQGKCACGTKTEDDAVCATETAVQCFGCCNTAGYAATIFANGDPSQCSCQGKFDSTQCRSARNAAEPGPACAVCCLNRGYLTSDYDVADGGVCTCSSL